MKILCILWWISVVMHSSKPTECPPPGVKTVAIRWLWCVSVGPSVVANSGHSLLVRWLGLSTSIARAWVWSLVRERHPTSHRVQQDLKKKKARWKKNNKWTALVGGVDKEGRTVYRSVNHPLNFVVNLKTNYLFKCGETKKKKTINIIHECTE